MQTLVMMKFIHIIPATQQLVVVQWLTCHILAYGRSTHELWVRLGPIEPTSLPPVPHTDHLVMRNNFVVNSLIDNHYPPPRPFTLPVMQELPGNLKLDVPWTLEGYRGMVLSNAEVTYTWRRLYSIVADDTQAFTPHEPGRQQLQW